MNSSLREIMWPRKQKVATLITGIYQKRGSSSSLSPGYLISWHEIEAQHRVSELVNSGEKEGKENGKLRENAEMSILSEEESVYRARTAVPNSVATRHMGLFK